jgi:sugar lactone lactonase YvrE
MKKKRSYFIFAGILLLVISIFTVLSIQNKQAIENPDIKQIGRAELFARGIQRPQGLALDEDGRLFAQSAIDGKISIIDKDGKVFDYTYLKDYNGYGIVIDQNDNTLMASNHKVVRVDSFGRVIQEYTGFVKAYDVKLAPDGTIFVSDAVEGRIYTISPKGEKKDFVGFDVMKSSSTPNAAGICFDKDFKNLYCVNTYT